MARTRNDDSGLQWRKSAASGASGACVEVAFDDCGDVFVRDTKAPDELVLCFTRAEWDAFLLGVRRGEFDG